MPKNKMSDLRDHLFEAMERLKDAGENSLLLERELKRAKAVSEVAQTIINSAKVEVEYLEVTGALEASEFLKPPERALPQNVTEMRGLSTGKNLGSGK